jgi:alkanesulfonate monooxygenase SsuD/methylene tetrahydromethanopterin reductase-like flavin-dependent oxidoreductase (luciferase family)
MTAPMSGLPSISVMFPIRPDHVEQVVPFARLVERASGARLWLPHSYRLDAYQVMANLAGRGIRVPFGTAVSLIPMRHPFDAALAVRSVAILSGQQVTAGFGTAIPDVVASLRGRPYASPVAAAEEYLTIVRSLLRAERPEFRGRYFTQGETFGVFTEPTALPIELGLGVLDPGMARLAGRVADVAVTFLTPPEYLHDRVLPALRTGAAGRQSRFRVVTVVNVALSMPGRDLATMVWRAYHRHLTTQHYIDPLVVAGVRLDPADPPAGAVALLDSGMFVTGDAAEVVTQLHRYGQAGVDEVVLDPTGVVAVDGYRSALKDLMAIMTTAGRLQQPSGLTGPGGGTAPR